ncbi:hypothetical protein RhiirA5_361535 [Rhizophagus irregularis]|uniref:SAM domain-containing protein n=2 Tax=Rhizophagus irregularis TaxID=588596 RepID=A0A2N0PEN6_9GLOM|nr:hypothetical protein RhiirA5_361535 [Rhizophagus irregularis]RGB39384.1 hypothetical protein C1646_754532 [Rhizophagus diaphanus] [Rhizophagus sp. MUCL 43196]GBC19283.1 hypothetical protein GLOIN_2v1500739 [Rhizophagus irregularis DAOM 181602=DAOM 197198]PKC70884.1 hypothetical protein RhiirA1_413817 [Rhizophagus irregularis]PKK78052.1 hypothetical protein RhiirC2_770663 [Rhizophagus irregularis]
MSEIIHYDTEELISYLRVHDDLQQLIEEDFDIIRKERITGRSFLKLTEEKLRSYGMKGGPASDLADFVESLREKLGINSR